MKMYARLTTLTTGLALAAAMTCADDAQAVNLLANPGFEAAGLGGGDVFGAAGWTDFGGATFTVHTSILNPVGANSGDHAFKMFGGGASGILQQFPINPGQTANGSVVMLNFSGDQMANGQVAAVNIEWIQADGSTQSTITPFISNGTFTAADAPVNVWTEKTITGVAPADAAFARFVLITGDFQPGGPGGAPFYDDAFFEVVPEPTSLALITLGAVAMLRRRRHT